MSLRLPTLSAALLSLAAFAAPVSVASAADLMPTKAFKAVPDNPFFLVNDNRLTYSYQFGVTDPGVPGKTDKQVYAFTHFDVWAYGTNFINLDVLKSDSRDPASGCAPAFGHCAGATEFYGFFRSTIGFNQVFNTKAFTYGPLRGVSLEFGADAEVENNPLAPAKRDGVAGLQFAFDLPYKGFFNVAPLYYKEINHNSFDAGPALPSGNTDFRGTWAVETNYYMDLGFLPESIPLAISGRAAWYGPKGSSDSPLITFASKTEFNSEPIRLTLDASKVMWGGKYSHFVDMWVAYRYWQNKFGLDHNLNPNCIGANAGSCTENALSSGLSVKF
jgi:hypothetical protein